MLKEKTIAIILLISMFFHFWFIIVHLNHECTHDDSCPICSLIHKFTNDLNGFNPDLIIVIIILLFYPLIFYLAKRVVDRKKYTLVELKVELLN